MRRQGSNELSAKLDQLTHTEVMRWLAIVVAIGGGVLAGVFGIYFFVFAKMGPSDDQGVWGQFGDFVGGAANPLLSFLTLIALALTIVLQSRQLAVSSQELALSRKELEMTREELRRSADAQELSEKALRAQAEAANRSARLTGINFLLATYRAELKEMQGHAYRANDPRVEKMENLARRENELVGLLDQLFTEVTASGGVRR
jgi:hypothetical protein